MNPFAAVEAARRYARGRPYHHRRTVARALGDHRPGRALDVACGTGLSTRALVELGIAAVGVDVVPAMVAVARVGGLPVAVASAEALPVRDASVDLVTVGSGVHWFEPDRFGAEAARVLRPDGALLLYEHSGADLPDEPAYREWVRGTYATRHPAPPRGPLAAEATPPGFTVVRADRWPDLIPFTRDGYADYLATQSSVLTEPADELSAWLRTELTPFFPAGPRPVTFHVSYQLFHRRFGHPTGPGSTG